MALQSFDTGKSGRLALKKQAREWSERLQKEIEDQKPKCPKCNEHKNMAYLANDLYLCLDCDYTFEFNSKTGKYQDG